MDKLTLCAYNYELVIFMNIEDFDYELPENLIAQCPIKDRSSSKLLVLNKTTGEYQDMIFKDIVSLFKKGDVLVLNNTKVLPARIYGEKADTHAHIELLLLKDLGNDTWECLSRPFKRLEVGTIIIFNDELKAEVIEKDTKGIIKAKFIYKGIFLEIIEKLGTMPLPPYIHETLKDQSRYQTVYAKYLGSSAAPTAGLHFTTELLEELTKKGVELLYVTLHVGLGTFRPVMEKDITKHNMHSEEYEITEEVAMKLNKAKEEGRNIYAVGTTSTRTLEANITKYGLFKSTKESTNIYIYPGYEFKAINGLITNFHLPKSTLIMLVSALAGTDHILNAYKHAIESGYRFFSFGDAMLIK